jgi:hypothetical protein
VSKLETLLRGDVNFPSTNQVEMLNIAGSVSDARLVQYVLVLVLLLVLLLVLVLVLVLVSKLETLLHSCNSNWRRFSVRSLILG